MKNKIKAVAPAIIVLILVVVIVAAGVVVYFVAFAPKLGPGPGPGPGLGVQIYEINDYGDLVNFASHIKYQWISYDAGEDETSTGVITFNDEGDDVVDGFYCREFSIVIESDGDTPETTEITMWVDKSDWTTVRRLIIDDYEVPEEHLPMYHYIRITIFWPFTYFFGWEIDWAEFASEVGTLQDMGWAVIHYPPSTLHIHKWRFIPNPLYDPFEELETIDVWLGQVGSYYILTYFKVTDDDSDYVKFELLELTT